MNQVRLCVERASQQVSRVSVGEHGVRVAVPRVAHEPREQLFGGVRVGLDDESVRHVAPVHGVRGNSDRRCGLGGPARSRGSTHKCIRADAGLSPGMPEGVASVPAKRRP